jgi:putative membrane-bound dehydrogenase-like protein
MDEVALYRRGLSETEVLGHFKVLELAEDTAAQAPSPVAPAGGGSQTAIERPPRSPAESLKALHLPGDLAIELVASEPLIASPVAIDWGADGKLWVVEMADYPYGMDGKGKAGGRIKYLESSKGDGHYDKSTLFLDGIKMPNGIIAWRKGVIVTAATEIFYAEDTDGDGRADKREVLFKGFKEGNPQLRENGLRWGIDNWLYVASGLTGGVVESTRTGQKLDLKGRDLRVRPDTGEMELVSGPSQFGREHDDAGRWFGTDNSHPLFHYVLEDRYLRRNAYLTPPDSKNQLLPLPLPPVFPKSPFAKRYIGLDHHGHFTSACGISMYRDELLFGGEGLHAFICEPVHNLVQHQVLTEAGATFTAKRVEGEAGADFLASEDNWFRPVMTRCGPDGAIWVVDMYRFMIEHPDWLNETGKKELAPFYRDGAERGRIYRIYPKNGAPRAIVRMDQMGTAELAKMLESPSGYVRDRAQQMLLWRGEPGAVAELARLFGETKNARARLHALCAIEGLVGAEKVSRELIARGLGDSDAAVRVAALRIAEVSLADTAVLKEVTRLRADPSPFVRLQLACTLGASEDALASQTLAEMAIGNPQDSLLASAIASSMGHHSEEVMQVLLARPDAMGLPIFRQIVQSAAASDDRAAMEQLVNYLVDPARRGSGAAVAAVANLMDALAAHGKTLRAAGGKGAEEYPGYATIVRLIEEARQIAPDAKRPMEERVAATELLGRLPDQADAELEIAGALITSQNPAELQLAAIRAAARTGADAVARRLLAGWATHSPAIRAAVADALLPREAWALALAESPAARGLDFSRRQRLLNHASAKVKAAAKATLAQAAVNADRQRVIDGYQVALSLVGDVAHGQALFGEHCATCHRMGNAAVGHDIGPNLLSVRDWPKENILTALLDPDRTVEPRYVAYTATLAADGSALTGLLTSESAGNVILKTLDDVDHPLPRSALKSLVSTNRSLMPQGFEAALQAQDVADLMAYVQSPSGGK